MKSWTRSLKVGASTPRSGAQRCDPDASHPGGFSKVYLAQQGGSGRVAIKQMRIAHDDVPGLDQAKQEVGIMVRTGAPGSRSGRPTQIAPARPPALPRRPPQRGRSSRCRFAARIGRRHRGAPDGHGVLPQLRVGTHELPSLCRLAAPDERGVACHRGRRICCGVHARTVAADIAPRPQGE